MGGSLKNKILENRLDRNGLDSKILADSLSDLKEILKQENYLLSDKETQHKSRAMPPVVASMPPQANFRMDRKPSLDYSMSSEISHSPRQIEETTGARVTFKDKAVKKTENLGKGRFGRQESTFSALSVASHDNSSDSFDLNTRIPATMIELRVDNRVPADMIVEKEVDDEQGLKPAKKTPGKSAHASGVAPVSYKTESVPLHAMIQSAGDLGQLPPEDLGLAPSAKTPGKKNGLKLTPKPEEMPMHAMIQSAGDLGQKPQPRRLAATTQKAGDLGKIEPGMLPNKNANMRDKKLEPKVEVVPMMAELQSAGDLGMPKEPPKSSFLSKRNTRSNTDESQENETVLKKMTICDYLEASGRYPEAYQ